VTRGDTIEKAITLLLQEGVDHLVVSQNQRQADGVVTWESIGRTKATRTACNLVQDCMAARPWTVRYDEPLYDAVREISRRRIVLVTSSSGLISGSVTPADIADQFVALSEPFLFLEQIENHLRALIRTARLGVEGLKDLVDPRDEARLKRVKSVDDLTFGEILRAFEQPAIWETIGLPLDRKAVLERLTRINKIRNHVMHFHPDGITDEEREILSRTREMLQTV